MRTQRFDQYFFLLLLFKLDVHCIIYCVFNENYHNIMNNNVCLDNLKFQEF